MRRPGWMPFAAAAVMAGIGGCNAITGASDITLVDDEPGQDGDGDGAQGAGDTTTGSGGTGTTGQGGGTVEEPPDSIVAVDGVVITSIDLYQAIRRPLVDHGAPASSDIPIVAGRDGLLRVFYSSDGGYNGQPVTAQLTIGEEEPIEQVVSLVGSSSQQQLSSTINFEVPGEMLTVGTTFRVALLQKADESSGANDAASYPKGEGQQPLDVQQGAKKLKIKVVPTQQDGEMPDVSPGQIELFERYFQDTYPVAEVEVTVRDTFVFGGSLYSSWGWSEFLDDITDLHQTDGAPDDVYYYGWAGGGSGGIAGMGWMAGPNDVWSRNAVGMGWSGEESVEVALQEIGHAHGLDHAPCGVSGDPSYPHPGGVVGVWGYRSSTNQLIDPQGYVDFMSYCYPVWISDWTFAGLFQRAKHVDQTPKLFVPEHLKNRAYDRVRVIDGTAVWLDPVTLPQPPMGEQTTITAQTSQGEQNLTGHFYRYSSIDGGTLYILKPLTPLPADLLQKVRFSFGGKRFVVTP